VLRSARPRMCHRGPAVIYSPNASRLIWQEPLGGEHSWSVSSQRMLNFKSLKSLSAILDDGSIENWMSASRRKADNSQDKSNVTAAPFSRKYPRQSNEESGRPKCRKCERQCRSQFFNFEAKAHGSI
jgi:hypothetical protein